MAVDPITMEALIEEAVTHGQYAAKLVASATIARMAYAVYLFNANEYICTLPLDGA